MRRVVAVVVVSVAALFATAAGETTTTTAGTSTDEQLARTGVLQQSDFPAGWQQTARGPTSDTELDAQAAKIPSCKPFRTFSATNRRQPRAKSENFDQGQSSVANTVSVFPSTDRAVAAITTFRDARITGCLERLFTAIYRKELEKEPKTAKQLKSITTNLGRQDGIRLGDAAVVYQGTVDVSLKNGAKQTVGLGLVAVRAGRALAGVFVHVRPGHLGRAPTGDRRIGHEVATGGAGGVTSCAAVGVHTRPSRRPISSSTCGSAAQLVLVARHRERRHRGVERVLARDRVAAQPRRERGAARVEQVGARRGARLHHRAGEDTRADLHRDRRRRGQVERPDREARLAAGVTRAGKPRTEPVPTLPAPPIWNVDFGRIPPTAAIAASVARSCSPAGRRRPRAPPERWWALARASARRRPRPRPRARPPPGDLRGRGTTPATRRRSRSRRRAAGRPRRGPRARRPPPRGSARIPAGAGRRRRPPRSRGTGARPLVVPTSRPRRPSRGRPDEHLRAVVPRGQGRGRPRR